MSSLLKFYQIEQNSSNLEMDTLLKEKEELKRLQKKILTIYNDWYSKLTDQEKLAMKNLGMIKGDYCYSDMIDYILFYKESLSSEHKVYEYLIKLLRGVERIRNILMPCSDL